MKAEEIKQIEEEIPLLRRFIGDNYKSSRQEETSCYLNFFFEEIIENEKKIEKEKEIEEDIDNFRDSDGQARTQKAQWAVRENEILPKNQFVFEGQVKRNVPRRI